MKKRHLRDLYVRGALHTVDDGDGGVTVYLKKLNLNENEQAVRIGNAAKARTLAAAEDEESDLYQSILLDALEASRETLIGYLTAEPLSKRRESVEAEIADNPEWDKDGYLQGLTDAWNEGLREKFSEDPEDPDAKPVYDALKRYSDEVEAVMEGEAAALAREYEDAPDSELQRQAVKHLIKARSDMAWVDAYRKAELVFAIRDPDDHHVRYYRDIRDLEDLEIPVLLSLLTAYRELSVDPNEGKELEETPSS